MPEVVDRIFIYPIKSLDPANVPHAEVLQSGALKHDREFVLRDGQGRWINGKREARIHRIRARYDASLTSVELQGPGRSPATFDILSDRKRMEEWFSDFLNYAVRIDRDVVTGFPDDSDSPGPTIIGAATLREVGSWFQISDPEEMSRRFRSNIEIATDVPFWEDRLYGEPGEVVEFRVGEVRLLGVNPCQRCAVPSRDPWTGDAVTDFQRRFMDRRSQTLPAWAAASRFDHYYRLAVNTRALQSEAGKTIHVGDSVIR